MAVTWNSGDASANITLSGGSLVATSTSATQGGVRCNTSASSGKKYWEAKFTVAPAGGSTGMGWANSTASLGSFFGNDLNGTANYTQDGANGQIWFNNASLGAGAGPGFTGLVVSIAFDIGGKLIWARLGPDGLWNNNATADPASGTGGLSVSTINAGPYFPCFCSNSSGQSITANFGATYFNNPIPSGFSALDTGPAYNASTKFNGLAILGTDQDAVDATKYNGLGILGTPQQSNVTTKTVAYLIYIDKKLSFRREYPYLRM